MSTGMANWRRRRAVARTRREFDRALAAANTPAMEHELLTLAGSRQWSSVSR